MRRRKHTPLSDWLLRNGVTAPALAADLGVSRAAVYAWAAGANRPTLLHAQSIVRLTNGELTVHDLLAEPTVEGAPHDHNPA